MAGSKRARVSARDGGAHAPQAYNGATRTQFGDLQRARIISAMFDVACERGASGVTVAHVVERAGVSRRTFYKIFTDRDDCFLVAFQQALSYASERVLPAYEAEENWREKIRAGLIALLRFLDEESVIGKLLIVETHAGVAETAERRREVITALTSVVDEGLAEGKGSVAPLSLTAEGVVGGALSVIHSRLVGERHNPLLELTSPLMSMIVLPYLGAAAARREFDRPTPASSGKSQAEPLLSDPFKEAGMRLTYRTVRVLMAVAEHPGASNRLVADTAEINDQGQISKLLARLERVGMIANTGLGPGQGAPNEWTLTSNGHQVVSTIRAQTEGRWPGSHER